MCRPCSTLYRRVTLKVYIILYLHIVQFPLHCQHMRKTKQKTNTKNHSCDNAHSCYVLPPRTIVTLLVICLSTLLRIKCLIIKRVVFLYLIVQYICISVVVVFLGGLFWVFFFWCFYVVVCLFVCFFGGCYLLVCLFSPYSTAINCCSLLGFFSEILFKIWFRLNNQEWFEIHGQCRWDKHARASACTHVHPHEHTHTHIHKRMYARTHTHTNTHTYTNACTHAHKHTYTSTCNHAHTRAHTHTHTHKHKRARACMHTRASQFRSCTEKSKPSSLEGSWHASWPADELFGHSNFPFH